MFVPCFHEMFLKFTSIDSNSGFDVPEVLQEATDSNHKCK